MLAIYSKISKRGHKCTIFQLSETLKYHLWENEDDFRLVRIRNNGNNGPTYFNLEIPKEIAIDLATELMRIRDNGIPKSGRQIIKRTKT